MATLGLCGLMRKPSFFRRKSFALQAQAVKGSKMSNNNNNNKASRVEKKGKFVGEEDQLIPIMELQNKIMAFRDIMDFPPCNPSASLHETVIKTLENLETLYPEIITSNQVSQIKEKSIEEGLAYLCKALKSVGESWNNDFMMKFNLEFPSCNDYTDMRHLGETVVTTLELVIKMKNELMRSTSSFSESNLCCSYSPPLTPTSVLPQQITKHSVSLTRSSASPFLWSLRLQSVGKLNPIDIKRLSFHIPQSIESHHQSPHDEVMQVDQDMVLPQKPNLKDEIMQVPDLDYETNHESESENSPTPIPIIHDDHSKTSEPKQVPEMAAPLFRPPLPPPPPPPPRRPSNDEAAVVGVPPPPPPPVPGVGRGSSNGCGGGGPPPPPPGGAGRCLRVKATTKLKRSTHLGNLYRTLKGKVEGSSFNAKSSGRRGSIGQITGGSKQGMADALAEMTKRSSYFQQIEEDVGKYRNRITELRSQVSNFTTKEMTELVKFHQLVESVLENLTDESQVLSRFEGFPTKKLEAIRMAAALYNKLNSILIELQNWNIMPPLSQFLDKVERYFNKIKTELDTLERTKDEESKKFKTHNIDFDFHILLKIKEAMVDVSSTCMELALKEYREESKSENGRNAKMLWRAFQFAFRVYTFAGGHDDRADRLTRELAREIETN